MPKPKLSTAIQKEVELYSKLPPDDQIRESIVEGVPDYQEVLPPNIQTAVDNAWEAAQAILQRAGICICDDPKEYSVFQTLAEYAYKSLKLMADDPEFIVRERARIKADPDQYSNPDYFLELLTSISIPAE
jgi:hypothetical protein